MSILLIRILFFCCVPIGIFILVKGIKLIRKAFYGPLFLELSYLQGTGHFTLTEEGDYSVWHKAPLLKRVPIDRYRPHIYNDLTNEEVNLSRSYSGMQANSFDDGRIELFTFSASLGNYTLQLKEGSSISGLQKVIANIIPQSDGADLSKHFIQVRKTQPVLLTFLAIPIIILGGGGIIGGFVLGLLADQVFK
ncbi:hypothetical protein MUGA111182_09055 [Mucilaginibacter galii]|uniref:hypothetical protein n=1 Tax=Mucilaginibacter galii TaxID=2005073 RepID=UPI00166A3AFE|nr:hypothetical protein [Mucilaginibacter galii]